MESIAPRADMSLYRTSSMYRLPGTFHSKNRGRSKCLVASNEGATLTIPLIKTKEDLVSPDKRDEVDLEDLEYILFRLLTTPISQGTIGRNTHAFKIAAVCRDLGMGTLECGETIHRWNTQYCNPPLQWPNIQSTINSAYRGR